MGKVCSIEECSGSQRTLISTPIGDLCSAHYRRYRNGKDLTTPLRLRIPGRLCSVPGCGRPHKAKGFCHAHWKRNKDGVPLDGEFMTFHRTGTARDDLGRKQCRTCGRWLPIDLFYKDAIAVDGLLAICKPCHRAKRYKMTLAEVISLLTAQAGLCACCQRELSINDAVVDHDHACCPRGRVTCGHCTRGLLCSQCNCGIGLFYDNPDYLRRAAKYLEGASL